MITKFFLKNKKVESTGIFGGDRKKDTVNEMLTSMIENPDTHFLYFINKKEEYRPIFLKHAFDFLDNTVFSVRVANQHLTLDNKSSVRFITDQSKSIKGLAVDGAYVQNIRSLSLQEQQELKLNIINAIHRNHRNRK